jgi:prepilin-type N-terminal cleavage/methylation domain-containing protein
MRKLNNAMDSEWGSFTLVELLIVIAIVSILVSLLFPALAKAKAYAEMVVCRSNMKQVLVANFQYASDFRVFGGCRFWDPNNGPYRDARYSDPYTFYGAMNITGPYLGKYLADRSISMCPAMERDGVNPAYYKEHFTRNVDKYWSFVNQRYVILYLTGHSPWDSFARRAVSGPANLQEVMRHYGNYPMPHFTRHANAAWFAERTGVYGHLFYGNSIETEVGKTLHLGWINVAYANGAVSGVKLRDFLGFCRLNKVAPGDFERASFIWGNCSCHCDNDVTYGWSK